MVVPQAALLSKRYGTFPQHATYLSSEDAVRAYLANLPTGIWALAVALLAYPVAKMLVPVVVHAMVPEVVRSVLHAI